MRSVISVFVLGFFCFGAFGCQIATNALEMMTPKTNKVSRAEKSNDANQTSRASKADLIDKSHKTTQAVKSTQTVKTDQSKKKNKYFAYGKIEYPTKLYSSIVNREKHVGNTVYPKGYPIGRVTRKLKPGDVVYLEKVFQNDTERRYTLKIDTKDENSGYIFYDQASIIEFFGDRGAILSIELSIPYEFLGDIDFMIELSNKYSRFVENYPSSKFVPIALYSMIDLNLSILDSEPFVSRKERARKKQDEEILYDIKQILEMLVSVLKDEECKNLAESLYDISTKHGKSLIKLDSNKKRMDKEVEREFSYKLQKFRKMGKCVSKPFDSPKYE